MATESILPLTINHSSLQNNFSLSVESPTHQNDPLVDLDSILLSADDTLLSGLLANDDEFLNELLNPTLPPMNGTITTDSSYNPMIGDPTTTNILRGGEGLSPIATSSSYMYPYDGSPSSYLYSTSSGSHSPNSSEGYHSPPWDSTLVGGAIPVRGVALSDTPPLGNSPTENRAMVYTEFEAPPISNSDVHIDVDMNNGEDEEEGEEGQEQISTSSERKTGCLVLSEEEKKLLVEEGIHLPTDMPLTKAEERHLKRIRRKIKNKHSAAESRKRKREYVDGLEKRVEKCTADNLTYKKRIESLESENKSLLSQLHKLQAIVSQYSPSKIQAGSFLMVLMFSFSILVIPGLLYPQSDVHMVSTGTSRTLLNIHTDQYGNIIDPTTGQIISDITPVPLPPWKHQSPVLKTFPHHITQSSSPLLARDL